MSGIEETICSHCKGDCAYLPGARLYLFRGKRVDNNEWVYGSFIPDLCEIFYGDNLDGFIKPFGKTREERLMVEVDRKTVGQYTGLTDKNGKKIFKGDILKISFGKGFLKAVVKFGYYNQTDKILKSHLGFYFDFVDSESYRKDVGFWTGKTFSKIEIIGNIHDNPELMGGNTHG